jgi:ornithine cyclodeaminase
MLRILSATDVRRALRMSEAMRVVKSAFRQLSSGEANVPLRTAVESKAGVTLLMSAHLRGSESLGVKVVSVYADNAARGLPTVTALVTVLDAATGQPLAVMEGTYLTALRTGAASGVATDLLARKDARVLAVFGAGAQARTQIEAVCCVRDIRTIRLFSRTRSSAEKLRAELASLHPCIPASIASSPAEAVRGADVIVTATNSSTPVFDGSDLAPGVHVNAIGAFRPDMQEVDEIAVQRAKVVVDQRAAALSEAGDLIVPIQKGVITPAHVHAELGEILNGAKRGREREDEITLFKSVGNAAQDVAIAQAILRAAEAQGLGWLIPLFSEPPPASRRA